jgi:threonine synthase
MSIWRWADWLDFVPEPARISLGEGNTPLVRSRHLGPRAGLENLYFKLEASNPTASYKDRFAAAAISHMRAAGQRRCVATSSGNTGSSLAAFCAAAGMECLIAIVEGAPEGKLQQMLAYGAKIYRIRGFGVDPDVTTAVFRVIEQLSAQPGSANQVSTYRYCPKGMSGVKTLSYELAEQLSQPIDHVFCPTGGGGMALAVARGFADLVRLGKLAASPRVEVVQPKGNDTIATPLRNGHEARSVRCTTQISGLQVPNVLDGDQTIAACRASGGTGHVLTDEDVWEVQARLAREEGIFCEPAAATSVTAALQARREGWVAPSATVVCPITGSGFKDPSAVQRLLANKSCPLVEANDFRRLLDA